MSTPWAFLPEEEPDDHGVFQADAAVQCDPARVPPPIRQGDLVRLPDGGFAVVLADSMCHDAANQNYPLPQGATPVLDRPFIGADRAQIRVGEMALVTDGRFSGRTGAVWNTDDGCAFLSIEGWIVATNTDGARKPPVPPPKRDLISEEVVIIQGCRISKVFLIREIGPDGLISLMGSQTTLKTDEYGSNWKFAHDVGESLRDPIPFLVRKRK